MVRRQKKPLIGSHCFSFLIAKLWFILELFENKTNVGGGQK